MSITARTLKFALAALVASGAGAGAALGASAAGAGPRTSNRHAAPTVAAAQNGRLHQTILVMPGSGRTLYRLKSETASHILCVGACTKLWRPLLVSTRHEKLIAGTGVHGRLSIVRRPSGTLQVAFNAMPLYTFAGDRHRGEIHGQGFMHIWFVLTARQTIAPSPPAVSSVPPSPPVANPVPPSPPVATVPPSPPVATVPPSPPATNPIPQNNGGDMDADNNGAPSDGDGNV